jgi:demethylmenaquinone methyltransferase/2-methoxy-6-polyprenyl-1,4-benzoquinol methylase
MASPSARPDRAAALEQYRRRAHVYDLELRLFEPIRRRAMVLLELEPGQRVLDVGCGTGLSFAGLRRRVGASGRIVGIEQSPDMIAKARRRVAQNEWRNVTLVNAPVAIAAIRGRADAALFHFTHDILRDRRAVANVLRHLKPGARVVACGLKWSRPWAVGVNLAVLAAARRSVTTLEGLVEPWDHLARRLDDVRVESALAGGVFIATGIARRR